MVKKRFFSSIILIIFIIAAAVLLLLLPPAKISEPEVRKYKSMYEFQNAKLQEITSQVIKEKQNYLTVTLTEEELNELLYLTAREDNFAKKIRGQITGDKIHVFADIELLDIIPSQFSIVLVPGIVNNQIVCTVDKAKLGRIPVSSKVILKYIKVNSDMEVDTEKGHIILLSDLPSQIVLSDLEITEKSMKVRVDISIKSLRDLILLLENFQGLK